MKKSKNKESSRRRSTLPDGRHFLLTVPPANPPSHAMTEDQLRQFIATEIATQLRSAASSDDTAHIENAIEKLAGPESFLRFAGPIDIQGSIEPYQPRKPTDEEIDATLERNGIPPVPPKFVESLPPSEWPTLAAAAPQPIERGWGYEVAQLVYHGLCVLTGGFLGGVGLILGGWAALKAIPCLGALWGS